MSDAFAEAISTSDSPAPPPSQAHIVLLGDPHTEGNEHLLDGPEEDTIAAPERAVRFSSDDIHFPLASSDYQN